MLFEGSNLWFTLAFVVLAIALAARRVPASAWGAPFVSIGILGTFWGILVALLSFQVSDIEASVPGLIDGMRTAFATSVIGISVSVLTKVWDLLRPRESDSGAPSAEQFLAAMRAQVSTLEAVRTAIGGEGDSSLLVQMQKLRLDLQDFMKRLSADSTGAIVDALKEVIRDFNTKINEQFGDNFKQLNEAVGRLVVWMDAHQQLVTSSHAELRTATDTLAAAAMAMSASATSLSAIREEIATVRESLRGVADVLTSLPPAISDIRGSLGRLGGDADALRRNVDALGRAVDTLTRANESLALATARWEELAQRTPEAAAAVREMVEAVRTHANAVKDQHFQLVAALKEEIATIAEDLEETHANLTRRLGESLQAEVHALARGLRDAQSAHLEQLRDALEDSSSRNRDAIGDQIRQLDEALSKELTEALRLLGGKLGSLSEQFVKDYGPLTAELARIVQLARHVEAERLRGAPDA